MSEMRESLLPGGRRHKKGKKKRNGRYSVRPVTAEFDNIKTDNEEDKRTIKPMYERESY